MAGSRNTRYSRHLRGRQWRTPRPARRATSSTRRTASASPWWRRATRRTPTLAVAAARRAFDDGRVAGHARSPSGPALLRRVADLLVRDREEIALLESRDAGQDRRGGPRRRRLRRRRLPLLRRPRRRRGPGRVVDAGSARVHSVVVHEPVGVCALITPWNYPLLQASLEDRPGARRRQHLRDQAQRDHPADHGRPDRAARRGRAARRRRQHRHRRPATPSARAWPSTPTWTSSPSPAAWSAAPRSPRPPAATVKKVALELGGKNPNVVFADACATTEGFDTAVDQALNAAFIHSGQVCSAGAGSSSRSRCGTASSPSSPRAPSAIRLGRGTDDGVECGPLVSEQQRAKTEAYVASALAEGAVLRCGGKRPEPPDAAGQRLLLRAHRAGPVPPRDARGPRGGLRPGPHRRDVPHRGRGRRARPTTPSTASPARCGRPTPGAPAGSPAGCATAPSGSTTSTPTSRRRSGAASASPASGASSGPPVCAEYRETKHVYQNLAPKPVRWFAG